MTKKEARDIIHRIFNYIDGSNEYDEQYDCILGHPALYFFHSKDELDKWIEKFLNSKETFDKYDLYYFINKMIKFLVGPYDSHTKLVMTKSDLLPIQFKFIDNKIYVIRVTRAMEKALFGELVTINGVDIETLKSEIEAMTCYSTKEYLEIAIQAGLSTPNILRSLPSFDKSPTNVIYTVSHNGKKEDFTFDLEHIKDYPSYEFTPKKNYSYRIQNDALILVYNSCEDIEAMKKFVQEISTVADKEHITKFVVDLRGNRGGNSRIIDPLIDFLRGKEVVTLIDEYVFSSGRMACVSLSKIGSYFIGTNTSTTLNAFGNNPKPFYIDELDFKVSRSTKYFQYDSELQGRSYNKTNFKDSFKDPEYFNSLDPLIFQPNELVYRPLEDYINGTDSQLNAAFYYLKELEQKIV